SSVTNIAFLGDLHTSMRHSSWSECDLDRGCLGSRAALTPRSSRGITCAEIQMIRWIDRDRRRKVMLHKRQCHSFLTPFSGSSAIRFLTRMALPSLFVQAVGAQR